MTSPAYVDPTQRARLSLFSELTKVASKAGRTPVEDQLTSSVGWLADLSPTFARRMAEAFLADDEEGLAALAATEALGARVQVNLPSLGAGLLRPDISIDGSGRSIQLLIEAKVSAGFGEYSLPSGVKLSQPDAYAYAWRLCDANTEAKLRRVGTLTLDGVAPSSHDPWRVKDLSWKDVHGLLADLLEDGLLEPALQRISADLRDHLAGRVLPAEASVESLEWGAALTRGVCQRLKPLVPGGGAISGQFKPNSQFNYAGGYLKLRSPEGATETFWCVFTPTGGDYNVPGWPASIQLTGYNEQPLSAKTLERVLKAGFVIERDRIGYRAPRAALPVEEIQQEEGLDEQIAFATSWALGLLREAELVPQATGALSS